MELSLGIETSCDETAAAVVRGGRVVLSSVVSSQIDRHAEFGGVVPELAAREHLAAIRLVVGQALSDAGANVSDLDMVAVTNGPGLTPALLVGANFALGLAACAGIPLVPVDHVAAHVYAPFLNPACPVEGIYPCVGLVVSGGHTLLILIRSPSEAEVVGTTLDDAAGEALDKAAKLLGLGYPGGPVIDRLSKEGNPDFHDFPVSLCGAAGRAVEPADELNFSFSGVKTSLMNFVRRRGGPEALDAETLRDVAASYQKAVVRALVRKTMTAVERHSAASVILSGGVARNSELRRVLADAVGARTRLLVSNPEFCADNGAMVAGLGWQLRARGWGHGPAEIYSRSPSIQGRLAFPISH